VRRTAPWQGFAVGAIAGYAAHRLASRLLGEPDPRTVIAAEHVGFYWRALTATWWGVLLAAFAWRFPGAEAPLRRVFWPVLVVAVVVVALCR
jgi:hypothetical protein